MPKLGTFGSMRGVSGNRYSYRDQVFTGETWLQTEPPIDPSSLTRWRKRMGEAGVEELLAETIEAAKRAGVIKASSVKRVIVDTTVMEKAIAHPTDSRLLERCREHLVKTAARHGLKLRQNYNREAPHLALQIGRYAHAKQYKRMRKALRTLRSRVGRVMRDVERQVPQVADSGRAALLELIGRTKRILTQKPKDKNKLYALHAPEVECLAKGKARKPYEFGVKVSITTTHKEGLVVGMRSMPGNPYDGHTLAEALEQAAILCDATPGGRHRRPWLQGCLRRGCEDLPPGLAAGHHTRTTCDDQTAQRNRASHRSHEDRRKTRSQLAQGCARRRDARGAMRRRPQSSDDPQEAAASLCLYSGCLAQPPYCWASIAVTPVVGKTNCSGRTNHAPSSSRGQ